MSTLASPPAVPAVDAPSRRSASKPLPQQTILACLLALEVLIFTGLGGQFLSSANLFEIARNCVELGVLALTMTLVIVTGGIDLSVGSLMSLCAVLLGKMSHDAHVPIWLAVGITLVAATLAGGLNAGLIARLRMPPLIATLGTYSLFSGLAEGVAYGKENPHDFPASFLTLGNGYVGPVPNQLILLLAAIVAFFLLLHRTTFGRAVSAIGYAPEGARYAGIPVERRIALTYVLTGLCAGLAAVVAVARVNNAKADAGSGYELMAITAVVLGGTSIFGGRGSIPGTIMGVVAIVMMKNGLRMANRPAWLTQVLGGELAGILTGLVLLLSIAPAALAAVWKTHPTKKVEEFEMRNSQLAVLCAVILGAALIVAGGNLLLVKSLPQQTVVLPSQNGTPSSSLSVKPPGGKTVTIAMMPKSKGNSYFVAAQKGANDCVKELGTNVEMIWDGPTNTNPAEQSQIIDTWINRGVDVIAVACEDGKGISTSLRKAREKGIKVITWDSDSDPDARDFFVNQATPQGIGSTLMDNAAKAMGEKGDFAIITASLTSTNMNEWIQNIKARLAEKYPNITLVDIRPCDDQKDKAQEEANLLLNSRKDLKLIMAICSPAVPGAAEAVKQSGRTDVKVMGLGLPSQNRKYIKEGVTDDLVLWNTMDLGYLTVLASYDVVTGKLASGMTEMDGGRIGKIEIKGTSILLGKPFTFTKDNIDQFDF